MSDSMAHTQRWLARNWQKVLVAAFWLIALLAAQWYARQNQLTPLQVVQQLLGFFSGTVYGPLIYIAVYALRPLLLFPATLLTLGGGFVFGPVLGVLYTVIGANISAAVAYTLGRFLGTGTIEEGTRDSFVGRYTERMRQNGFETILLLRFLFAPYDLVNYLSGFLRIPFWQFILATALGSLPGTLAFVLFGASVERFDGTLPAFNPWVLAASFGILIISIGLSRYLRKREQL